MSKENQIEDELVKQLAELKYIYRADMVERKSFEKNGYFTTINYAANCGL